MSVTKIRLSVDKVSEVSEELYDLLLTAFYDKAESMGLDVAQLDISLENWVIECDLVDTSELR